MKTIIFKILDTLEKEGYEAYIVGGFVRDFFLGKESFDVDISTSAEPDAIEKIFKIKPNQFGGIHFKKEALDITITSFREDLSYEKGFPKEILFKVSRDKDIKRRDFTINALYMDKSQNIIADASFKKDLENKIIRIIGNPLERIKEDPTRIIRALRFKVDLDFQIEENLLKVIKENKDLLQEISLKRINKEIEKVKNKEKFKEFLKEINYI